MVVRKLTEMGAEISVHDPYVDHWYELENQDTYPAPGHSWARFFRNQEDLVRPSRAEGPADGAARRRSPDPGRPARALSGSSSRTTSSAGPAGRWPWSTASAFWATANPPLLRAGLRGQGPRARPHPAHQGRGPLDEEVARAGGNRRLLAEAVVASVKQGNRRDIPIFYSPKTIASDVCRKIGMSPYARRRPFSEQPLMREARTQAHENDCVRVGGLRPPSGVGDPRPHDCLSAS